MVTRIAMAPCVLFLRAILALASDAWEVKNFKNHIDGCRHTCRMREAYRGRIQTKIRTCCQDLLEDSDRWKAVALPRATLGLSAHAFSQVVTASCSMEQLSFGFMFGIPFGMFDLETEADAMRVLMTPECLFDTWSLAFLRHFTSPVAMISLNVAILLSARVRAILVAYGMMLRWEISRIECRHASLRKRSKVSFTWGAAFQQCSASFLLQRSRTEYAWLRRFFPELAKQMPEPGRGRGRGRGHAAKRGDRGRGRGRRGASGRGRGRGGRGRGRGGRRVGAGRPPLKAGKARGKGSNQAGGGWYRAAVNQCLSGTLHVSREAYYASLSEAGKRAREHQRLQTDEYMEFRRVGSAVVSARQASGAGAKPFGVKPSKRPRVAKIADPVLVPEHEYMSGLGASFALVATGAADRDSSSSDVKTTAAAHAVLDWQEKRSGNDMPGFGGSVPGTEELPGQCEVVTAACMAPGRDILQAVFDAMDDKKSQSAKLQEMWGDWHRQIEHIRAPADPGRKSTESASYVSPCGRAGRCVCQFLVRARKHYVPWRLSSALKTLFHKGAPGRSVYDRQAAVVRIVDSADGAVDAGRFFYVGSGNLTTGWFVLQELQQAGGDVAVQCPDGVLLLKRLESEPLPHDFVKVGGSLALDRVWHLQLFRLLFECDVAVRTFVPLAPVIAVGDRQQFWLPEYVAGSAPPRKLSVKPLVPMGPTAARSRRRAGPSSAASAAAADPAPIMDDPAEPEDADEQLQGDDVAGAEGDGGVLSDDKLLDAWEVPSGDDGSYEGDLLVYSPSEDRRQKKLNAMLKQTCVYLASIFWRLSSGVYLLASIFWLTKLWQPTTTKEA